MKRGRPPQSKPDDPLKQITVTLPDSLITWLRAHYDTVSAGLRTLIRAAQKKGK